MFSTALGITEDVEKLQLKGTRKRKGKKLDEDFIVSIVTHISLVISKF
jgi:[histone H3]-lysine36 N-trimethyltransferase